MDQDALERYAVVYDDPDLGDTIQTPKDWTETSHNGSLMYKNGASIEVTGVVGRFVAKTAWGITLSGRKGGIRYFKTPSAAISALRNGGHL